MDQLSLPTRPSYLYNSECELSLENKENFQSDVEKCISPGDFNHQFLVRLDKIPNRLLHKYNIDDIGKKMVSSPAEHCILTDPSLENEKKLISDVEKSISLGAIHHQPFVRLEKLPNSLLRKYNIYYTGERMVSSPAEHCILTHEKDTSYRLKSCGIDNHPQPMLNLQKFHQTSDISGFVCKFCAKRFKREYDLKRHLCRFRNEVEALRFACDLCGKLFRNLSMLKFHKAGHQTDRPHDCALCGVKFKTVKSAKIHQRTHRAETRLRYRKCDKQVKKSQTLKKDKSTALNTGNASKCKFCGLPFYTRKDQVTKDPPLCQLCKSSETGDDYPTDAADDLCKDLRIYGDVRLNRPTRSHSRRHSYEKTFPCFLCGKRFILSISLHSHMMAHNYSKRQLRK